MTNKIYTIYRSKAASFNEALEEILAAAKGSDNEVIRIVIFGAPENNTEHAAERSTIERRCREIFAEKAPIVGYIAQTPLRCRLAAEVTAIDRSDAERVVRHGDYLTIDEEILSGGIYAPTTMHIGEQARVIFERMDQILKAEGVATEDIVRQWNYIEQITHLAPEGQHYQLLNDERSRFYSMSEWSNGYPAATGIGAQTGGLTIMFDAVRGSANCSKAVDNPLQVSAHAYSQQVLINNCDTHKTTPKFERARYVAADKGSVYISGTAAIRGEESCRHDVVEQTALTMENIDYLVSRENLAKSGVENPHQMEYSTLRVYLKHREDLQPVVEWMDEHYPQTDTLYLWADICREELLIEIEGIAVERV